MKRVPGNPKEKQQYLSILTEKEFPFLIADILSLHFHHSDVKIMEGPGDGKRDIFSTDSKGNKNITQCKFHHDLNKTCGSRETDEIIIAMGKFKYTNGIFCTSGKVSPQSKREYLDNYPDYDLSWLEGFEIAEIVIGNNLLRKLWFDGEKIARLINSISIPFLLRELPANKKIVIKNLKLALKLHKDVEHIIDLKWYERNQFISLRDINIRDTGYATGRVEAYEVKLTGKVDYTTLAFTKTRILKEIKRILKPSNQESCLAVRFGIPYFNNFNEEEEDYDRSKFNLPLKSETYFIEKIEGITEEKSWLINLDNSWKLPDYCSMSRLSYFCYYNPKFDICLFIYYTCLLEPNFNVQAQSSLERDRIIWQKSLFLSDNIDVITSFIKNNDLQPDKLYEYGPTGVVACWLHPRPMIYSVDLRVFEKELHHKDFEQLKDRIRSVANTSNIRELNWQKAAKVAALNDEDPFPGNRETAFSIVDVFEKYHEIPSPIDPAEREFVFECVWAITTLTDIQFENKLNEFSEKIYEFAESNNLKFTIDNETIDFVYLKITYLPPFKAYLSTKENILQITPEVNQIFSRVEEVLKSIFPNTLKTTRKYWWSEIGIDLKRAEFSN